MVARRGRVEHRVREMEHRRDQETKELEGMVISDGAIRDLDQGARMLHGDKGRILECGGGE